MRNVVLSVFMLLALSLPVFAKPPLTITPYCWDAQYTSCPVFGATQNCTDGMWSDYVCECKKYWDYWHIHYTLVWDCDEVR
jgi:hypothetical protein